MNLFERGTKLYFEAGSRAANAGASLTGLPPAGSSSGGTGKGFFRAIVDAQDAAAQKEAEQKGNAAANQVASDLAYRHRLSQQAALMIFSKEIIDHLEKNSTNVNTNPKPSNDDSLRRHFRYKNFTTARIGVGDSGHFKITNRMTKDKSMNLFFNKLPSQVLSLLIPKIELYKIFYPKGNSFASGLSWRIPFDDVPVKYEGSTSAFVASSLEELLKGTGKGHGIGIKSFNYSFKGTNPAEIQTSIAAELQLYFQTPEDIVKDIDVVFNLSDKEKFLGKFSYSDMINQVTRTIKNGNSDLIPNDQYYRIKAVVGYAPVDRNLLTEIVNNNKIPEILSKQITLKDYVTKILTAIEKSKIVLFLSPYSHDISFNEDGSSTLNIKFNSATDISLYSQQTDIFRISDKLQDYNTKEKILSDFLLIYEDLGKKADQANQQTTDGCEDVAAKQQKLNDAKKYFSDKGISIGDNTLEDLKNTVFTSRRELYNSLYSLLIGKEGLTGRTNGVYSVAFDSWIAGVDMWGVGADKQQDVITRRAETIKKYTDKANAILSLKKISFKDETSLSSANASIAPQVKITNNQNTNTNNTNANTDNAAVVAQARADNDRANAKLETFSMNGTYAVNIKFVFLGDILDAALECIKFIDPVSEQPKIVLGEIPVTLPMAITAALGLPSEVKEIFLNLADVPVCLDLFHRFLVDRIVDKQLTKYSVFAFIQDIIGLLIKPAIDPKIFGLETIPNNAIRFSMSNVCLPCSYEPNKKYYFDPLFKKQINDNTFNPIINDTIISQIKNPITDISVISSPVSNYLFIYCSSTFPRFFKGIESLDNDNGVFHFRIGTDSGIVKTIKFSRSDVPYQREFLAAQEGQQKGIEIKQVYNSTITMFGNNIYYVGDYIYIEPYYFGTRERTVSLAKKIGLGGYYQIMKVNSSFSDGDYSTTIECTYQAEVVRKEKQIIVKPFNSNCRSTQI